MIFVNKHFIYNTRKKDLVGNLFYPRNSSKSFIINEKVTSQMVTDRAYFHKSWTVFSNFQKKGEVRPPPSLPLVTYVHDRTYYVIIKSVSSCRNKGGNILSKRFYKIILSNITVHIVPSLIKNQRERAKFSKFWLRSFKLSGRAVPILVCIC